MPSQSISFLKFVGTVSLGLLTGVSYTVSSLTIPTLLQLPTSAHASLLLTNLTSSIRLPALALSTLTTVPLLLSYLLSPRSARHPYLLYTSLLSALSLSAPSIVALIIPPRSVPKDVQQRKTVVRHVRTMEASYEVLGEEQHEEVAEEIEPDDVNGEDVRAEVEVLAKGYMVRAGIAALGFAMAVVGIWGDGAPQTAIYVS